MSRLVVHKHAVKYIQKLPSNKKAQVKKLLKKLAEAPADYPGTISMVGKWSGYKRIRIGSLRVIRPIRVRKPLSLSLASRSSHFELSTPNSELRTFPRLLPLL